MQASSITNNIIKTCSSAKIVNILTDKSQSLFDLCLSNIDNILMIPINTDTQLISCDLILSNNPIAFSSKAASFASLHLNNILYFHSQCPHNFKKEDRFLLKNSILTSYKIFANDSFMQSWGFDKSDDCCVIPYGLKQTNNTTNKTRSVVVLNMNNNSSIDMLFHYIQSVFKDAIMIKGSDNQDHILSSISESVICIEAESYFNIITAIANGCSVISSIKNISEPGLFYVESYNNIIQDIYSLLKSYDPSQNEQHTNSILIKYSYENFLASFNNKIKQIRQEPYIYVQTN